MGTRRTVFRPSVYGDGKAVDGAWWPRTRDLVAELPALLTELSGDAFIVTTVSYHRDSWDGDVGRKRIIGDSMVRLGWFRTIDPHVVSLAPARGQSRLDLVVVPPESDPLLAEQVFAWIEDGSRRDRASDILTAARAHVEGQSHTATAGARAERMAKSVWEYEGGSTGFPPWVLRGRDEYQTTYAG